MVSEINGISCILFNVEIYGTVADWTMIIVTAITAYFLYETLKSQKEVQENQKNINLLQTFDIRKKYKPNLQLTVRRTGIRYTLIFNNSENSAYNINISSPNFFQIENGNPNILFKHSDIFEYKVPKILANRHLEIKVPEPNLDNNQELVIEINQFLIKFEDEFGLKYSRNIIIYYDSQEYRIFHNDAVDIFL